MRIIGSVLLLAQIVLTLSLGLSAEVEWRKLSLNGYRNRCRVTCDLARKFHVVIDCQESLHELLSSPMWFQSTEEFKVLLPASNSPLSCHIFGSVRQQIMGTDPSVYPSLTPLAVPRS
jgi:hypothetical protein